MSDIDNTVLKPYQVVLLSISGLVFGFIFIFYLSMFINARDGLIRKINLNIYKELELNVRGKIFKIIDLNSHMKADIYFRHNDDLTLYTQKLADIYSEYHINYQVIEIIDDSTAKFNGNFTLKEPNCSELHCLIGDSIYISTTENLYSYYRNKDTVYNSFELARAISFDSDLFKHTRFYINEDTVQVSEEFTKYPKEND